MGVVACNDVFSLHFTDAGLKYRGACWLYYADIVGESGAYGTMVLHDGTDTNGDTKAVLQCQAKGRSNFKPSFPVYFRNGVYVEASNAFAHGFIQVLPV